MLKANYDPDGDGKVVSAVTADNVAWTGITGKPVFANVAITGSYTDLLNVPVIPAQVQPDWNATTGLGAIANKPFIIPEAPADNALYGRKNNSWVVLPPGTGGLLIQQESSPVSTILYPDIIFDDNFTVTGNKVSLFQNGNIICGIDPNIRSTSQNEVISPNSGMVVTAHSMNDSSISTMRPQFTYANIFDVIGAKPAVGAEGTADFVAGYFDARTSNTNNRERVWGINVEASAELGWDATKGVVMGAEIDITNKTATASDSIRGVQVVASGSANCGWGLGVVANGASAGFHYGMFVDGVKGAGSAIIYSNNTNNSPATGIDFSQCDFTSGVLIKGNCLSISQSGVFDTPCTNKAVFNQGLSVVGQTEVTSIKFPDNTIQTTAAIAGYWDAPYIGLAPIGTGANTLVDGHSKVCHLPSGSWIFNRKGADYYGVQLTKI